MRIEDNKRYKITRIDKDSFQVMHASNMTDVKKECPIKRIGNNRYIVKKTGEIKEFVKEPSNEKDYHNTRKALLYARDKIIYNITDINKARHIVLTYEDEMKDTNRLQQDLEAFIRRLRRKIKCEYIAIPELQKRGTWHYHVIVILEEDVYIDNKEISDMWRNGETVIEKIKDVAKLSLYVTKNIKRRLYASEKTGVICYPKGMRVYRTSKNIKAPPQEYMLGKEVRDEIISKSDLVYEKRYSNIGSEFVNIIDIAVYKEKKDKE